MLFTFSAPEDWKAGDYGTQSILPPAQITLLKLVTRLGAAAILTLLVVVTCRRQNSGAIFVKFIPLFLFLAWSIVSVFWSPLKTTSLQQLFSIAIGILVAFAVSLNYEPRRSISHLFFHLTSALTVLCAGLILLAIFFPQYGALTKKASGLFHSTAAGASASLAIILILTGFGAFGFRWSKVLFVPTTLLASITLVISANRLSIGLTAFYSILICAVFWKRKLLAFLMTIFAVGGLVYLMADPKLKWTDQAIQGVEKYVRQGQSRYEFSSISGRSEMWGKMWESYQDAPWIGHGYFVTSKDGRIDVWGERGNWTAHNIYLQVLVSTGLIGLIFFTLAVLIPIAGLLRRTRLGSGNRTTQTSILLATLISWYLLWGLLNSSIIGPTQPETVVFMVLYGLIIGWSIQPQQVHPESVLHEPMEVS